QEVAMLFRDLRIALPQTAATGGVDQRPGLVARRILEGRTPGTAAERLRFLAGAGDCVHLGADRLGLSRNAAERRLDHDRPFGHLAVAIGVAELVERPFDQLA